MPALQSRLGDQPIARSARLSSAVRRRWPSGLAVVATACALAPEVFLSREARLYTGAWSVLVAAVIYLVWGTLRGDLENRVLLAAQTAGVLGFGALALAVEAVGGQTGLYVLAAGWLAHAGWDVVHHHLNRVVPRWYAETCMVCDLLVATVLIVVAAR
jgi:hypothetical protein